MTLNFLLLSRVLSLGLGSPSEAFGSQSEAFEFVACYTELDFLDAAGEHSTLLGVGFRGYYDHESSTTYGLREGIGSNETDLRI